MEKIFNAKFGVKEWNVVLYSILESKDSYVYYKKRKRNVIPILNLIHKFVECYCSKKGDWGIPYFLVIQFHFHACSLIYP